MSFISEILQRIFLSQYGHIEDGRYRCWSVTMLNSAGPPFFELSRNSNKKALLEGSAFKNPSTGNC
ncbi:hypothetical protein A5320_01900 [Rheinheimera sp. SA_1]|nr:hypothetical protein A5320_01900 [Rheinheimera sp. SA_1]